MRMRNSLLRSLIIENDTLREMSKVMSSTKRNKRKRMILTIEHKLEICGNVKQARTFTKAIEHVKFFPQRQMKIKLLFLLKLCSNLLDVY